MFCIRVPLSCCPETRLERQSSNSYLSIFYELNIISKMVFEIVERWNIVEKHFLRKPNPYITENEAKNAMFYFIGYNVFAISTFGSFFD